MTTEANVRQELLTYIQRNARLSEPLETTTDLLEIGAIDSLMVADLFVLIETRFGVVLKATDVSPHNFRSVDRLVQLVLAKQQKSFKAA